ncbi:putative riboflavin kinase-like protein [Dinothrombium tinctorium]|uniref:riboflavin kinase n=1 Tax=Dinothrombium tinctorium TaxID=1965070 RepID=A0A443QNL0_9ACAR|nr:putative riboflavin kinase-like protein [Dinothrombium tinctorium]
MPNISSNKVNYPFYICGKVVKGYGRGSKQLGCPTANIESDVVDSIELSNGIYYGFAQLQIRESEIKPDIDYVNFTQFKNVKVSPIYMMCCSLGTNPYFNNKTKSLEVHILNQFDYDFYDCFLRVAICGFIRCEKNFNSLQELIDAIHSDIELTKQQLQDKDKWRSVVENGFFVRTY